MAGDSFAISALRRKRAHVAGEIEQKKRELAKLRRSLDTIDATLNLFEPATNPELIPPIRPLQRGLFFRRREAGRLALDALREAGRPVPTQAVADWIMACKGLPADPTLRTNIEQTIRANLRRLVRLGRVRQIASKPEAWWELTGRQS